MRPLLVEQFPPFSVAVFRNGGGLYFKLDAAKPYRGHNPGQYVIADRSEVLPLLRTLLRAAAGLPSPDRDAFRRALAALGEPPPAVPDVAPAAPAPRRWAAGAYRKLRGE